MQVASCYHEELGVSYSSVAEVLVKSAPSYSRLLRVLSGSRIFYFNSAEKISWGGNSSHLRRIEIR